MLEVGDLGFQPLSGSDLQAGVSDFFTKSSEPFIMTMMCTTMQHHL